jgi:hypothetical protein
MSIQQWVAATNAIRLLITCMTCLLLIDTGNSRLIVTNNSSSAEEVQGKLATDGLEVTR